MALVNKLKILQFVGYQNSGKTTLVTKLIDLLSARGSNILTIKHHGHGGKPDIVDNKDNSKHVAAGAVASIVEGEGRLIMQAESSEWKLAKQIELASVLEPQYIFIEGHKKEGYPKVVMLRNSGDAHLLDILDQIKFVIYWDESISELQLKYNPIPFYSISDEQVYDKIIGYLERE